MDTPDGYPSARFDGDRSRLVRAVTAAFLAVATLFAGGLAL